jgi:hypothetical protein
VNIEWCPRFWNEETAMAKPQPVDRHRLRSVADCQETIPTVFVGQRG